MEELVNVFKAFSDETRLRILKLLEHGELCVCDLVAALEMVQPKVSFHLAILKEAGLVRDRKDGKWTHYKLSEEDMFRRLLLYSVMERMPERAVAADRARLQGFITAKIQNRARNKNSKKSAVLREIMCSR